MGGFVSEDKNEKVRVSERPAGTSPEMANSPTDCPTIVVDGLGGISISPNITRLILVEHVPIEDKLLGRYVATLQIQNTQFQKIMESLQAVAQIDPPTAD